MIELNFTKEQYRDKVELLRSEWDGPIESIFDAAFMHFGYTCKSQPAVHIPMDTYVECGGLFTAEVLQRYLDDLKAKR